MTEQTDPKATDEPTIRPQTGDEYLASLNDGR